MRGRAQGCLALALLLALVSGCKGGGGVSSGDLTPSARFTEESRPGSVTDNFVWLREESRDDERIVLEVVVSDVTEPVAGIAMTMSYPDGFSSLVGCEDGELFPTSQQPLCEETEPGTLFVSRVVPAPAPAVPVVGDQVILRFELIVFGVSEGPIEFQAENLVGGTALLDADADPIQVDWFAGLLRGE